MFRLKRSKADRLFSNFIRERADWTCERCHKKYEPPTSALHCSHYHGRGKKSVRWNLDNASALCYGCHRYFTAHPLEHTEWFKKRLGQFRFNHLLQSANRPQRIDEKEICKWLEFEMDQLKKKHLKMAV